MGFVTDVVLPLALAFIMLALGLGLTFDDFVRVARHPRDFAVGAASQIVVLPAVAFLLASVWPMAPELALGLMIIAAAPGGVTSNLLTSFARGDVALSISLTAVISLLSVITIPLVVVFAYGHFIGDEAMQDITVADTAISVFLIVTVPVTIGLLVRRYAGRFALRIEPAARAVSAVLFVLVLAGAIYQERENLAHLLLAGRPGHACPERGDDGDRLPAGAAVRHRAETANGHRDRVRAAERHAGHCHRGAPVRRRARDGAGRDLQPDHVRDRADLCSAAAPHSGRTGRNYRVSADDTGQGVHVSDCPAETSFKAALWPVLPGFRECTP